MKLLLASATEAEISPLLAHLQKLWSAESSLTFEKGGHTIQICITGVGMMATTYSLLKAVTNGHYDLALQAGVGGSFSKELVLGETVFVTSERYGDLGAEDHYNYHDIFDLGLLPPGQKPFTGSELRALKHQRITLKEVNSITVNTVSGSDFTIKSRIDRYDCMIENMEGAAFHYVCLQENIPFAQVRAISNYVTPRDKESWKMKEAIINLNKWLIDFIENI